MRGEGREVLLDRLVIADVTEHAIEDGQFGTFGRNRNARLRHQCQQADGFQGNRLAASVGAADDELTMLIVQLDAQRNHHRALRLERSLQQRMPCVAQNQCVGSFRLWLGVGLSPDKLHRHAVVILGEARFGELQLQFAQHSYSRFECVGLLADLRGHLQQDAMDLALLLVVQPYQLVVLLDGLEGLDNTVWPLDDAPCATPCTRRRCSTLTGMTNRSPRMVMSSSCTAPPSASLRRYDCSDS